MASAMKVCRVCGKQYEACRSANRSAGVFRWQEVACCPECGAIYLRQINESRGLVDTRRKERHKKTTETPVVEVAAVALAVEPTDEEPVSESPV